MIEAPVSELEILERGAALLAEWLPGTWQVQIQPDQTDVTSNAVINVSGQSAAFRFVVEAKRSFSPKDVPAVVRQASLLKRLGGTPVLVIASWLSERSKALLTEAGINYIDLMGAARIQLESPPVVILREVRERGPRRRQSRPALRGAATGRLVRLLADVKPPYGVRELAGYAGLTPGYVSRLLEMLEAQDIVERDKRGGVAKVDWRELIQLRAQSYEVFATNPVQRFVCPNGPFFALEIAGDLRLRGFALSGSFAAEELVSVAPPALLLLYATKDLQPLVEGARLLPSESGANVVIATPYDPVVTERPYVSGPLPPRVPRVAVSQLALDCLTGNGRMPQEGEALLDWMAANEERWRLSSLRELPSPEPVA